MKIALFFLGLMIGGACGVLIAAMMLVAKVSDEIYMSHSQSEDRFKED